MRNRLSRRALLAGLVLVPLAGCTAATPRAAPSLSPTPSPTVALARDTDFEGLEGKYGARLGVFAVDTGTGRAVGYRADERFAFCSTYKALAVGVLLRQRAIADLDAVVRFTNADLVAHSPIAQQKVSTGMTLREVCDAAIRYSDNTAGNLLFRELGGPAAITAELRAIGDPVTRLDRLETALNDAVPGDDRDTSTPRALAADLRAFALGDVLPADKRALLTGWLQGNTLTDGLVRAAVPAGWTVGDKSGGGSYGTRNDIAVVWPAAGHPLVVSIMSTRATPDASYDDALIAAATTVVLGALAA